MGRTVKPIAGPNLQLIELRLNAGLSRNRLSALTGISTPTIGFAEKGHLPEPRTQFALATFFDLQPTDIWPLERQRELE